MKAPKLPLKTRNSLSAAASQLRDGGLYGMSVRKFSSAFGGHIMKVLAHQEGLPVNVGAPSVSVREEPD